MRKLAGNSLRTSPRSGRPASAPLAAGQARPTPSDTRISSPSGPSKLLLLPVDPPPAVVEDLADHTTHEPVFIERRTRPAPEQRQRERQRMTAPADDAPIAFSTRVAKPLPAMPEDSDTPSDAVDVEPADWDAQDVADPGASEPALLDVEPLLEDEEPLPPPREAQEPAALHAARRPVRDRQPPLRPLAEPESSSPARSATPGTAPSNTTDDPPATGELHFGILLRRARERRGLAMSDVADKTRISPRWIRAIEEAQLDILPAPVFVSGYLRTYARLVGLDGQDLLERYHTLARKRAQAQTPHERGFTVRRHGQQVQVPPWVVFLVLLGLTAAVLTGLWLTNTFWRR